MSRAAKQEIGILALQGREDVKREWVALGSAVGLDGAALCLAASSDRIRSRNAAGQARGLRMSIQPLFDLVAESGRYGEILHAIRQLLHGQVDENERR